MVGICGGSWEKPGIGKTTVANVLTKHLGFYPVSFIDPVKDIAKRLYGWDGKMDQSARIMLDRICRMGREISEHYWRDMTLIRIPTDKTKIVFDDVYFANEFKAIVENGGIVLRVVRNGFDMPVVPCVSIDISNDGTLNDLQRSVLLVASEQMAGIL
jgi:hypothetical protein